MISNAIKLARNEHVVYFLLTSYLDARSRDRDGSALPEYVKRLPLAGRTDVDERLRALSQTCRGAATNRATVPPVLTEAAEVLRAVSEYIGEAGLGDGLDPAEESERAVLDGDENRR